MANDRIKTIQKILKSSEMILLDSTFDILNILSLKESYNINEFDFNLLISKKKTYLICESLFRPFAGEIKNMEIVSADNEAYLKNGKMFRKEIDEILEKERTIRLGLTNPEFSRYFKKYIVFHFVSPSRALGSVKNASEIRNLKQCAKILKQLDSYIEGLIEPGMTDIEIRNAVDMQIYKAGSQRRYVPTMIGVDSVTMFPTLTGKKIKGNELILADYGVMHNGTGLSISKTYPCRKAGSKKRRILKLCEMALDVMEAEIKPGISISRLENTYREFLRAHNMEKHSSDYAVKIPGISYSENINSFNDKFRLYKNSAVKISASLFIPGSFGVRQEKIFLINAKGGTCIA